MPWIEHTCKREGGTHVEILGVPYHFAPDAEDRHVALVNDASHVQWFLGIPGFRRIEAEPTRIPDELPAAPKRRGRPPKARQ